MSLSGSPSHQTGGRLGVVRRLAGGLKKVGWGNTMGLPPGVDRAGAGMQNIGPLTLEAGWLES